MRRDRSACSIRRGCGRAGVTNRQASSSSCATFSATSWFCVRWYLQIIAHGIVNWLFASPPRTSFASLSNVGAHYPIIASRPRWVKTMSKLWLHLPPPLSEICQCTNKPWHEVAITQLSYDKGTYRVQAIVCPVVSTPAAKKIVSCAPRSPSDSGWFAFLGSAIRRRWPAIVCSGTPFSPRPFTLHFPIT